MDRDARFQRSPSDTACIAQGLNTAAARVDPAAEVRQLDRTEFRPPLPEQNGTVPAEPTRSPAVPTGPEGIAPPTPAPIMSSAEAPVTSASSIGAGPTTPPFIPAPEERSAVPSASDAIPAHDATSRSATP
jgi:hypothetical protein